MKTIFAVGLALAALTGCATQQPYYANRVVQTQDPYQWHTVAVMPSDGRGGSTATYTTEELPVQQSARVVYAAPVYTTSTYVTDPVYYAPAPVYYGPSPYYYPPVAIGLDFSFGRWWGGGGRGRGWGGGGRIHR